MIIEKKKISDLIPAPYNPRQSTAKQEKHLKESLEKFGLVEPIIFNKQTGYIVGGHFRVRELKKLGIKEIECVIVDLNEADEKELNIRLNANTGGWDWDTLANDWDVVDLEAWGLEIPQFDTVEELEASEDDYEVPEGGIETDIVIGDLFEIGEHRLLCGDRTDSDAVARLMNGEKADMVFTDPPYGNGSSGKYGRGQLGVRTILSDENFDVVNDFFNLRVCDVYVFFLQWRTFKEAIQTLENNNLQLKTIAVWDKKNAGLNGAGGMSEQWEAIIVAGNVKYSRFGGNVFSISREQKKRIDSPHPHQKPIELLNNVLEYFQDYNLLLDPFLGSGSTMVAAHQLKRRCYGMELEPKYCQVIIDRMRKLDSSLIIKRNGIEIKTTK
jgi:DNA modification methylase